MQLLGWTTHSCNNYNDTDQKCLQFWPQKGLNLTAISISNRAIYDCNLDQLGPNMLAMSKIVLEARDYDFCSNLAKIKNR